MEIQSHIEQMKLFYTELLDYLDNENYPKESLEKIFQILEEMQISESKLKLKDILYLLSRLSKNHHRSSLFIDKIKHILFSIIQDIKQTFSNSEIFRIFKSNKLLLLYLIENKTITIDKEISRYFINNETKNYRFFFYPEIKEFISKEEQQEIEEKIPDFYQENKTLFEEYRHQGENESYVCSLIRQDLIQEFVVFVNRTNFSLLNKIKTSIFETNSFLMDKNPTLIEYASFFGSIQIIKYLQFNQVEITESMWLYAIHSNNANLIHLIEENCDKSTISSYMSFYEESIKCHHNEIADYIKDNLLNQNANEQFCKSIIHYFNCHYFPVNIIDMISTGNEKTNGFNICDFAYLFTEISIPSSITCIGKYAFKDCYQLKEISIPSSVKSIDDNAFYGCIKLKQISIPSSVTSIGIGAFSICSSLTEIEIPSSITSIEKNTFYCCSLMKRITIPSSVKSIGFSAFSECFSLEQIEIPPSLNSIETFTFSGCSSLKHIVIPMSVTIIGKRAFSGCSSLTKIEIPTSVTSIGDYAFYNCSSITEFQIPSSVTIIGEYAFSNCISLTKILIPSSVTSIGVSVFNGCTALNQISILSSISTIGISWFEKCQSLEQFSIPSSVKVIEKFAFYGCKKLKEIIIPSCVTSIESGAFEKCTSLIKISELSSVNHISSCAFKSCKSLEKISIPSKNVTFEKDVFQYCTSLKQITLSIQNDLKDTGIDDTVEIIQNE